MEALVVVEASAVWRAFSGLFANAFKLLIAAAVLASLMFARGAVAAPQYVAVDMASAEGLLGPRGGAFFDSTGPAQAGGQQASLWHGSAASFVSLVPPGSHGAIIHGAYATVAGGEEVGEYFDSAGKLHAGLWRGSDNNVIDLGSGVARGGYDTPSGSRQVGDFASIWSETAASHVRIDPVGSDFSRMFGGYWMPATERQFGYAQATNGGHLHAYVWSGSAASATDLHPATLGRMNSTVSGGAVTPGGTEWLVGSTANNDSLSDGRAIVWTGPDWTPLDLTPTGATFVGAFGTNGRQIVGKMNQLGAVWNSLDPNDYTDLSQYLPSNWSSEAFAIDSQGNIFGDALSAGENGYPVEHMIAWLVVPEPTGSGILVAAGFVALMCSRRRSRERSCGMETAPARSDVISL